MQTQAGKELKPNERVESEHKNMKHKEGKLNGD